MRFSVLVFLGLIAMTDATKLVQKSSQKSSDMETEGEGEGEAEQVQETQEADASTEVAATEDAATTEDAGATTEAAATETAAPAEGAGASPDLQSNLQAFADKLGIPMSEEILQLGSNEAISAKLVETAMENGKTEAEISDALGGGQ